MFYLDHSATSPLRPAARDAWLSTSSPVGNPSSLHAAGRAARRIVEDSREELAAALGCHPTEVVLTGGGTEADNLAVKGLAWAARDADPRRTVVVTSPVEHHAVLDSARWLGSAQGFVHLEAPVDAAGFVDPDWFATLDADTVALVSVMSVGNETGVVQPVSAIGAWAARHGIVLHTDAVQAGVGQLPPAGVAARSLSAHKFGGPLGIGALVLDRDRAPVPVLHGGGQERRVRSGTVPVPLVAAMAAAAREASAQHAEEASRIAALGDTLAAGILAGVDAAVLTGAPVGDPRRAPHIVHVVVSGCEADAVLLLLDAAGICCSTGAACTAGVPQPSHVLAAMGFDDDDCRSGLRFSLGWTSTRDDVDACLAALPEAVTRARAAFPPRAGRPAGPAGSRPPRPAGGVPMSRLGASR